MQRATIPSSPAALLKLNETPDARAKTSLPIRTPRSPFPSGESTNKKSKDVTKPVTNATATIVDMDTTHPSFQKKYLLMKLEQALRFLELFQHQKLIY